MNKTPSTERGEKQGEYFLVTSLFSRRLAYPLAQLCQRVGLSANRVTILGGLAWVASVPTLLFAGSFWANGNIIIASTLLVLTALLWNLGYILDVVDGSLARMTGTSSSGGYFLDYSFHLIYHPMFLCSVGLFLYMVTGHIGFEILAVLSICSGWGVSFHAKEHVLCEHIAQNKANPMQFSEDQRYRIYIDSVKTKQVVDQKRGRERIVALAREIFCFPGQYTFLSLVVLLDLIAQRWLPRPFMILQICFVVLTLVPLARVPFRLRREYRTLELYDELR